ncbi:MAG TPA: HEAT repeat domain-containing protein, partial [Caulifigura sp.]|nr:HEAT repeat domain-containing protein [Caulifigura sp.]
LLQSESKFSPELRLAVLLALKTANPGNEAAMSAGIGRHDLIVRRAAVQWAAEQRVKSLRRVIEECLSRWPMDRDLFLSIIAALEMLDGKDPKDFDKTPAGKYVIPLLKNEKAPPAVLVEALRLIDPDDGAVSVELLDRLIRHSDKQVHEEAVRTLAFRTRPDAVAPLMELAKKDNGDRQDALGGVIRHFVANPNTELRDFLLNNGQPLLVISSFRGGVGHDDVVTERLDKIFQQTATFAPGFIPPPNMAQVGQLWRLTFVVERPFPKASFAIPEPTKPIDWSAEGRRDPLHEYVDRGRFVFFHPSGPGCYRCHTIDGRGGKVGPDLSKVGATFTREKLIDSILEPSKEVSPQFTNWQMVHTDGRVFTGMIVHENEGKTILGGSDGKTVELKTAEIEERQPVKTSVMPEKLVDRMTVREWRDLLAFLESCGK